MTPADWAVWFEDGWPHDPPAGIGPDAAESIAAMAEAAETELAARLLATRLRAQHAERLEAEARRHGFTTFIDWSEVAYALTYGAGDPLWNNGVPPWHLAGGMRDGGTRRWQAGTDGAP